MLDLDSYSAALSKSIAPTFFESCVFHLLKRQTDHFSLALESILRDACMLFSRQLLSAVAYMVPGQTTMEP